MALKIRLRRQGRIHRPFYRAVVTDGQNPRNGRYVEVIGWYNPFETEEDKHLSLNGERLRYWLEKGAIMTEKMEALAARGAPAVMKEKQEKEMARRAKVATKRKARKKEKASK